MHFLFSTLALFSVLISTDAIADVIGIATDATVEIFPCRFTFSGSCQQTGNLAHYHESYTVDYTASASLLNQYGSAHASAQFRNDLLLPQLRAYAQDFGLNPSLANPDPSVYTGETATYTYAQASGIGHYRYDGYYPTQIALSVSGHSIVSRPNPTALEISYMQIGVFKDDTYRYDIDGTCPLGGIATCYNRTYNTLGTLGMTLDPAALNVLTILIDVKPGDEFYVGGLFYVKACCRGTVDSSHTMDMSFSDTSNLELLPVAGALPNFVPEPRGDLLFLVGISAFAIVNFRGWKWLRRPLGPTASGINY